MTCPVRTTVEGAPAESTGADLLWCGCHSRSTYADDHPRYVTRWPDQEPASWWRRSTASHFPGFLEEHEPVEEFVGKVLGEALGALSTDWRRVDQPTEPGLEPAAERALDVHVRRTSASPWPASGP